MTEDLQTIADYSMTKIENLAFSKAKKKEGFYVCPIKETFTLRLDNVSILSIKDTSNTLILKCKDKDITKYMDDFNHKILRIVTDNSSSWFNTNIDNDLIEEYYISTLQYDKKNGETIRLKLKNIDEIEDAKDLGDYVSIAVSLKYLKFFKQKFYPEFQVEIVEAIENNKTLEMYSDDEFYGDEEEHPVPSFEEVMSIKEECMKSLRNKCDELTQKLCEIENQYNDHFEKLAKLDNCEKLTDIIILCEMYSN